MTEQPKVNIEEEIGRTSQKSDGICHCPYSEIEYLIGVDNLEAVNIKTGKCLRCSGTRLNKIGKVLTGKRKISNEQTNKKLF